MERIPLPSLLTHLTLPLLPSHSHTHTHTKKKKNQTHTHLFTACWYCNYQHLRPWSLQRWPSLYVWFLHKWLFCQCFSWSDSRFCKVLGSRWAQKDIWRIAAITPQRQDGSLNQNLVCTSRLMIQICRAYEKIDYTHNEFFWGEQRKLLIRFKNGLRKQRKETGLAFMVVKGGKAVELHT